MTSAVASVLMPLVLVWAAVWAGDRWLRRRSRSYGERLQQSGITVDVGYVGWFSTRWNALFATLNQRYHGFLKVWFTIATWFALVCMVVSVVLVVAALVAQFTRPRDQQILSPVLPGVNLPVSQLGYFLIGLIASGIFHEFGHAVAAVCEGVPVRGFGVFLYVMYPGAFVEFQDEDLDRLPPLRQMRIFGAGVWHNFVLCVGCVLGVYFASVLLWPFYVAPGNGATVLWLDDRSPMHGSMYVGSIIERVNQCDVRNTQDWQQCILQSLHNNNSLLEGGHCVNEAKIEDMFPQSVYDCCQEDGGANADILTSSICFQTVPDATAHLASYCLPVRQIVTNEPCALQKQCPDGAHSICVLPRLNATERLISIALHDEPLALFVGDPRELYQTSLLTDYQPRTSLFPLTGPLHLELILQYIFSLSLALAVLNMVPAYYLDGHHFLVALINFKLQSWTPQHRALLAQTILQSCSFLFASLIAVSLYHLLVD